MAQEGRDRGRELTGNIVMINARGTRSVWSCRSAWCKNRISKKLKKKLGFSSFPRDKSWQIQLLPSTDTSSGDPNKIATLKKTKNISSSWKFTMTRGLPPPPNKKQFWKAFLFQKTSSQWDPWSFERSHAIVAPSERHQSSAGDYMVLQSQTVAPRNNYLIATWGEGIKGCSMSSGACCKAIPGEKSQPRTQCATQTRHILLESSR